MAMERRKSQDPSDLAKDPSMERVLEARALLQPPPMPQNKSCREELLPFESRPTMLQGKGGESWSMTTTKGHRDGVYLGVHLCWFMGIHTMPVK